MTTTNLDYATIKARQRATWGSGDYALIGSTLQIVGENLAEALAPRSGARVLDVAAGNGNATLAMARRGCDVTSTDYVESLLDAGRRRAEAEGFTVDFRVADAEALPFEPSTFDAVVSTFGVQFTPDQETAASELMRVCRPGGRIGLASWTPDGFIGNLFRVLGAHVPSPPGVVSPARWGTQEWIAGQFGREAADVVFRVTSFTFVYPSPQDFIDFFRAWYGPIATAFTALDEERRRALESDLLALVADFNVGRGGEMRVPSEYAESVITTA